MSLINTTNNNTEISDKDREILQLKKELERLKIYFGYDSNADKVSEDDHSTNETEESGESKSHVGLNVEDAKYELECKRGDDLSDLVIKLGEKQYMSSRLYNRMKKYLSNGDDDTDKEARKNFVVTFNKLKNTIKPEYIDKFFEVLYDWLDTQKEMLTIDQQIRQISEY